MFRLWQNRRTRWLMPLAAWPACAAAVATSEVFYRGGFGVPVRWWDVVRYPAVDFLFFALAIPAIYELAARFPLGRKGWVRHSGILLAGGMALVVAHAVYRAPLHEFVYRNLAPDLARVPVGRLVEYYAIGNLFGDLWLYGLILAFAHLGLYYARYQDREREWAAARLQALEAQLQPHFLFNTLNSIAALMHEDVNAADDMMANLATLLRRSLDQGGVSEIQLREEMDSLEIYLAIQRARFQDRLTTRVDADEQALDALVPRLILQPLVENAVRHGIGRGSGAGLIEVRARRIAGRLQLTVFDDGPGPARDPAASCGLGLSNTRARLAQYFEDEYRLELRAAPEGGAIAEIEIPCRCAR
ncbi:MAG TPA: histidine kinase [Bryobacteraceae bacterium]|jgi:two-component sensor histidine kinase